MPQRRPVASTAPVNVGALPRVELAVRSENVLDARICVLSRCRFLDLEPLPEGKAAATCAAGVHRAVLPAHALRDEVQRNPSPVPGDDADDNPFIVRLLMAPDCCRPECGVFRIHHRRSVLVPDPAELDTPLFEDHPQETP